MVAFFEGGEDVGICIAGTLLVISVLNVETVYSLRTQVSDHAIRVEVRLIELLLDGRIYEN